MKPAVPLRRVVGIIVFGLLAIRAAQFVRWAGSEPGNFVAFYVAGRFVSEGRADHLYDISEEVKTIKGLGIGPEHYHLWMHPAFEALAFAWVKPFSYPSAAKIWAGLMVLVMAAALWLLRDTSSIGYVVMGILLWGRRGVVDQDIGLLVLVVIGSYFAFRRGRNAAGGVLLALGLLRFHQIWLLPATLLLKRQWKALGWFCGASAGLGALSYAIVGPSMVSSYLHTLRVTAGTDNFILWMMPTARGFGGQILPLSPWIAPVLSCLVAAPVVIAWLWQPWDGSEAWEILFSLTVVAGVAITYHSFFYDIALLLLPVSVLGRIAGTRTACELFALIPLVGEGFTAAAAFPVLAAEVVLMLALWLRSRRASRGQGSTDRLMPLPTPSTAEHPSPSPGR